VRYDEASGWMLFSLFLQVLPVFPFCPDNAAPRADLGTFRLVLMVSAPSGDSFLFKSGRGTKNPGAQKIHTHDTPLRRRSPLLWSDPVGARRRRAKALRRRAPLDSGWLRMARGGFRSRLPHAPRIHTYAHAQRYPRLVYLYIPDEPCDTHERVFLMSPVTSLNESCLQFFRWAVYIGVPGPRRLFHLPGSRGEIWSAWYQWVGYCASYGM